MTPALCLAASLLAAGPAAPGSAAGDWPGWRGPEGSGVSSESGLPERWSITENVRWKAALPGRGVSGPAIARGKVFLTASSGARGERLHVLAFDAPAGKKLWERVLRSTGSTQCHPKTAMAAPTPAADGERVAALFATSDLFCFDHQGVLLWYRALALDHPGITNQVGMAASPIIAGGAVVAPQETVGESFLAAFDLETGADRWRAPRFRDLNWVTPLLLRRAGREEVLLQSRREITAYDARTGERRWSHEAELNAIPSPIAGEGRVFLPAQEVIALDPPAAEGEAPRVAWKAPRLRSSTASPLLYEGKVYSISSAGILACAGSRDGEVQWQERLPGPFAASPVAGDGKVYCVNEAGLTAVVNARAEPRVIAKNELGEPVLASPAISGGALYIRTDRALYAIGSAAAREPARE